MKYFNFFLKNMAGGIGEQPPGEQSKTDKSLFQVTETMAKVISALKRELMSPEEKLNFMTKRLFKIL